MHEVSLIKNVLSIAMEYASREQVNRIHKIVLRIGALSGVEPDSLRFAFDIVTQGTIAEQAELVIEICPTRCYCQNCSTYFQPLAFGYECPTCQTWSTEIITGKELELSSLEVS
jgi:hydrogenase nickel incorporation protein HypA/HybF